MNISSKFRALNREAVEQDREVEGSNLTVTYLSLHDSALLKTYNLQAKVNAITILVDSNEFNRENELNSPSLILEVMG